MYVRNIKRGAGITLLAALVMSQSLVAFAAKDDGEAINKIRIDVNADIDTYEYNIDVTPTSDHFNISDYEVTNEDSMMEHSSKDDSEEKISKNWSPELTIYLDAESGYYFKSNSKSYFEFSGSVAEFVSADRDSDKTSMELKIRLRASKGSVGNPTDLKWDSYGTASWKKGYDAKTYDLVLYRDGSKVTSKNGVSNTKYNFDDYITKTGDYTFTVKCKNGSKSSGIIESGTYTVNSDTLKTIKKRAENNTGYKNESTSKNTNNKDEDKAVGPGIGDNYGWIQDSTGWWFRENNNSYPMNTWKQLDNSWFRFDGKGYMITGWWQDGPSGTWYYLNPISDGTRGAMKTGWQFIDNQWYFFYDNGVMASNGWVWIGDKCYMFRDNGAAYIDCQTPDGYRVDNTGAWIH